MRLERVELASAAVGTTYPLQADWRREVARGACDIGAAFSEVYEDYMIVRHRSC